MTLQETAVAPRLRPLYRARFEVGRMIVLGPGPTGTRIRVPISAGSFEGERLRGEVMPGGSDWQLVRPDGVVEIDAHYVFKTHDAALISVHNVGVFHGPPEVMGRILRRDYPSPSLYYMRTQPRFQTASPAYAWLEHLVAIATCEVRSGGVTIDVFAVD